MLWDIYISHFDISIIGKTFLFILMKTRTNSLEGSVYPVPTAIISTPVLYSGMGSGEFG